MAIGAGVAVAVAVAFGELLGTTSGLGNGPSVASAGIDAIPPEPDGIGPLQAEIRTAHKASRGRRLRIAEATGE